MGIQSCANIDFIFFANYFFQTKDKNKQFIHGDPLKKITGISVLKYQKSSQIIFKTSIVLILEGVV